MAETTLDSAPEPVPGSPAIREVVRPEPVSDSFRFCTEMGGGGGAGDRSFGIRKVGSRAEIDTSPPFGSVKEAVTRFGGSGPWLPHYKLGDCDTQNGVDEGFDIKKAEEQAAQLEKDVIVKELEALDVLEELGTTKKIVEELKLQIQKESLKSMAATPVIRESNREHRRNRYKNRDQIVSSPDLILMELKQAKFNLSKTMNNLGVIRTSVESLNKKAEISRENLKMRWVAGRKMEEAAMAAEALAFAESTSGFFLPEPEKVKTQDESNNSKLVIIQKMLEEAAAEVKYSKQAMEEALKRVETANRKQLAAGEALRRWAPPDYCYYYNHDRQNSPANQSPATVSMRDILGRKQVVPEAAEGQSGRRQVALSEMLQELREDIRFPRKAEAVQCDDDGDHKKKHLFPQRRKFGFIHISLPSTKQSKKKNSSPRPINMI